MNRPYKPLAFANEFILKSSPDGAEHMKLQKLTYLAYSWWLAYHDDAILSEEPQVWTHGPVFKGLYFALRYKGRDRITALQKENPFSEPDRVPEDDEEVHQLIAWVWERYGSRSAYALSDLTHEAGSPWRQVAEMHGFRVPMNTAIPSDIIKSHYQKLMKDYGFGAD